MTELNSGVRILFGETAGALCSWCCGLVKRIQLNADNTKLRWFDYRSNIWHYHLFQRHWLHIKGLKFGRWVIFWIIFWPYFQAQKWLFMSFRWWHYHSICRLQFVSRTWYFCDLRTSSIVFFPSDKPKMSAIFLFLVYLTYWSKSVPYSSTPVMIISFKCNVAMSILCLVIAFLLLMRYVNVGPWPLTLAMYDKARGQLLHSVCLYLLLSYDVSYRPPLTTFSATAYTLNSDQYVGNWNISPVFQIPDPDSTTHFATYVALQSTWNELSVKIVLRL